MGILSDVHRWVQRIDPWAGVGAFVIATNGSVIAAIAWAAGRSIPGWVVVVLGAMLIVLVPFAYLLGRHRAPPSPARN